MTWSGWAHNPGVEGFESRPRYSGKCLLLDVFLVGVVGCGAGLWHLSLLHLGLVEVGEDGGFCVFGCSGEHGLGGVEVAFGCAGLLVACSVLDLVPIT